jgi:hypothetical protein
MQRAFTNMETPGICLSGLAEDGYPYFKMAAPFYEFWLHPRWQADSEDDEEGRKRKHTV